MREITASGQTVEEAVQSALEQLNTTKDQVEIDVIDEGKRGVFGIFGSKRAIVKVTMKKDPVKETEKFIKEVTSNMNLSVELTTTVEGKHVTYEMDGENIAIIIGKRGQTLNALQYLVHLAINKDSEDYYTVTLDAEGYRARRKETLESLAHKMADKAKRMNKKVALEPMPAFERKIIHSELQKKGDVSTYSDGLEPHRHIVIKP
ncbi:RNA-binding cell elongation regulator Jag/EloR [Oceanobacillus damuensis]|uniref:RNA-binding cell elongation regulator Jag/EloR n=1 Tax=Oceanobacillus damuensis TaxID=937928 RepID=UPI00082AD445|nr:RNA-binding cell elongation regulator Jag/EloR [Oceanobacillus damuensis]